MNGRVKGRWGADEPCLTLGDMTPWSVNIEGHDTLDVNHLGYDVPLDDFDEVPAAWLVSESGLWYGYPKCEHNHRHWGLIYFNY